MIKIGIVYKIKVYRVGKGEIKKEPENKNKNENNEKIKEKKKKTKPDLLKIGYLDLYEKNLNFPKIVFYLE